MNVFRKGMNSFRNGMNMFWTGMKTFRIGTGIRGNQNYQKIRNFSGSKNLKEFFQNSIFLVWFGMSFFKPWNFEQILSDSYSLNQIPVPIQNVFIPVWNIVLEENSNMVIIIIIIIMVNIIIIVYLSTHKIYFSFPQKNSVTCVTDMTWPSVLSV